MVFKFLCDFLKFILFGEGYRLFEFWVLGRGKSMFFFFFEWEMGLDGVIILRYKLIVDNFFVF